MTAIPCDILHIIISKCTVSTLFNVAATNSTIKAMIVWPAKKPKCIPSNHGLSPMRIANLTCFAGCMACRRPRITKITWKFGVRFCKDCLYSHTVSDYYIDTWDIPKAMYACLPHTSATLYNPKFGPYDLNFYWKDTIMKLFHDLHGNITPAQYIEQKVLRVAEEKRRSKEQHATDKKDRKKYVHDHLKAPLKASPFLIKHCPGSEMYRRLLDPNVPLPDTNWADTIINELEAREEEKRRKADAAEMKAREEKERNARNKEHRDVAMSVARMTYFQARDGLFPGELWCPLCTTPRHEYTMGDMWMHMAKSHAGEMRKAEWCRNPEWTTWLKSQPSVAVPGFIEFLLKNLVDTPTESTLTFQHLDNRERKAVHQLAYALGMTSQSHHDSATFYYGAKNVTVTKPSGWTMQNARTVTKTELRENEAQQAHMTRLKQCNECGCDIPASHALYHWSGMGPMCEECVNTDEELSGLKWNLQCDP